MCRHNLVAWILSACFIALVPSVGVAGDVRTSMTALQAETGKLGAPKVQGNDLYFGNTKASKDLVRAVKKEHGVAVTLFVKNGDKYVRAATTVKKEDGTNAVGTALDANNPAVAKLNSGEPYYGDATSSGRLTTLDTSRSKMHRVP